MNVLAAKKRVNKFLKQNCAIFNQSLLLLSALFKRLYNNELRRSKYCI